MIMDDTTTPAIITHHETNMKIDDIDENKNLKLPIFGKSQVAPISEIDQSQLSGSSSGPRGDRQEGEKRRQSFACRNSQTVEAVKIFEA